jgi:cation:H+ antiporter
MWLNLLLFIFGFLLLIKGADIFVDGSVSIARKLGMSTFVIGLTVVAFGTSAPELIISVLASFNNSSEIALGNIIGTNITNTLLILGATAMMSPLVVKKNTINKEIPFSLLAVFAVAFMVNDVFFDGYAQNYLTRIDGLVLLLFFCIFIYYTFGMAIKDQGIFDKDDVPKEAGVFKSIALILLGLAGLFLGGEWIVSGAVYFAGFFGISETFIGLTVVAIGTSLPELATSLMAAKKGNADMAVGGVVGSNIFNLFWVLGCSSIISPIVFNSQLNVDIMILISITILLLFLVYYGKKNMLAKMEGMIMIMLYLSYMIFLSIRG